MVRRVGLGILVLAVVALLSVPAVADYAKASRATCKVNNLSAKTFGTGVVTQVTDGMVWVQTNAHVVEGGTTIACSFYRDGLESAPLNGTIYARVRNQDVDAAIVRIPVGLFGGRVPDPMPIAPRDYVVKAGDEVVTVGCAKGGWPSAFRGRAAGYVGNNLAFVPPGIDGRSGSAIFDAKCEMIVGLLFARTPDNQPQPHYGYACSLQSLYKHLTTATIVDPAEMQLAQQCGPGGCPPQQPDRGYMLPYRRQQGRQDSAPPAPVDPPSTPWPGLGAPPAATPPAEAPLVQQAPPVDLSPLAQPLNNIANALNQPPAAPPANTAVNDATLAALQRLGTTVGEHDVAIKAIPKQIADAVKPVSDKVDATNELIAKKGTVGEKFALAKGEYLEENPEASKLKADVAGVKGVLGDQKAVGITIAVIAALLGVFGLVHWLRQGMGPIAEAIHKIAEKNPDNVKLNQFADDLIAKEQALRARFGGAVAGNTIAGPQGAAVGAMAAPALDALLHRLIDKLEAKPAAPAAAPVEPAKPAAPVVTPPSV